VHFFLDPEAQKMNTDSALLTWSFFRNSALFLDEKAEKMNTIVHFLLDVFCCFSYDLQHSALFLDEKAEN